MSLAAEGTSGNRLDGKVAIVTGAGRGIGRAEAMLLAQHGCRVVVNDLGSSVDGTGRDASAAASVVEEISGLGGTAVAHTGDIGDPDDVNDLLGLALSAFGRA